MEGVTEPYPADLICDNGHRWRGLVVSTLNENGTEDETGRDPEHPSECPPCPECESTGYLL